MPIGEVYTWGDGFYCVPTNKRPKFKKNYLHARSIHCCKTAICGYKHKGAGYGMTVADVRHVDCPRCKKIMGKK